MKTVMMAAILALSGCEAATPPPVSATPAAAAVASRRDVRAEGRAVTETFYRGGDLWARLGPDAKGLFANDPSQLAAFQAKVAHDLGVEKDLVREDVSSEDGVSMYRRVAHFTKIAQPIEVFFAFDADAKIVGLAVRPAGKAEAAPSATLDYVDKTAYRLPFDGTWLVFWGGRTVEQNQHAIVRDQRFAYDLLIVEGDATHRGNGTKNSDYFAYGKPIVASAAGRVLEVVDDVPENVPGAMPTTAPAGNHVLVDHGNGEIALYAHFVPGSIPVRVGDAVKAGQLVGRCGNSGHSSEPHLHWHLQTADGEGLPAQFRDYVADGKLVAEGEPVRGQRIATKK